MMTKDQPIYTKDELLIPLPRSLKLHKLTNDHEYIHGYCIALSDTITILQENLKNIVNKNQI